ncbi:MAG: S1C family serine protease [Candidatus Brocadiia bacterium]
MKFPSRSAALLLCAVLLGLAGAFARPAQGACDLSEAGRTASRSVVLVEGTLRLTEASVELPDEQTICSNTGFFFGPDGRVLTSLSAFAGCEELAVRTPDGRRVPARIVAVEQSTDLALLETELEDAVPLEPAAEPPEPGDAIVLPVARADGKPHLKLTAGLVCAHGAGLRLRGVPLDGLLTAALAAAPGTASAPVLDARGMLVGTVVAADLPGHSSADATECYILPWQQLRRHVARLSEGRSRRLGWLGISALEEPGDLEGVRVGDVLENSPAAEAGIRPGDVLLQVGEQAVEDAEALSVCVAQMGPREDVPIRLLRAGDIRTVQVDIEARPLLICGGSRRQGDRTVRLRWHRLWGMPPPASAAALQRLREMAEQNARLRERIRELEQEAAQTER